MNSTVSRLCRISQTLVLLVLTLAGLNLLPALEREPWDVYRSRRHAVAEKHSDGLILLFGYGAREAQSARSPFRQENNFYYLTGWNEPGAALLLLPENRRNEEYEEILFLPARNASEEAWTGPKIGPHDSDPALKTGFSRVRDVEALDTEVSKALQTYSRVYSLLPGRQQYAQQPEPDRRPRLEALAPGHSIADIRPALSSMRAVKSEGEIRFIQKAVDASIAAHENAWKVTRPGLREYQIGGLMIGTMMRLGCLRPAYAPIVGSGPRGLILHYTDNTGRLEEGELLLMDVGGEYAHYAADITRTVPVNGRFTARQKEIYQTVLAAQKAAIAAAKPGMTLAGEGPKSLYRLAREYFDSHGEAAGGGTLGKFFTHSLGHHVGLGVHDPASPYRPLKPGMVITIEPGLYIPGENIGVRIEDMLLVTEDGARVMSAALPKTPENIEAFMQDAGEDRPTE